MSMVLLTQPSSQASSLVQSKAAEQARTRANGKADAHGVQPPRVRVAQLGLPACPITGPISGTQPLLFQMLYIYDVVTVKHTHAWS
jgi:hypothetical protein